MKAGFELIEMIVVIVIIAILAAVAIPKIAGWRCLSDMDKCKSDDISMYYKACLRSPQQCKSKEDLRMAVEHVCTSDPQYCSGRYSKSIDVAMITKMIEDNALQKKYSRVDTVYLQKHDTVFVIVDRDGTDTRPVNRDLRDECIKSCERENVSRSLVEFCIRDKCR